jgi:hypothetical protein
MTDSVRPSGHLQVVDRGGGRRWQALWRDAKGRHQKVLGPAWVKDSGKRTARGAIVWHTANGPKPDPSYLTPADAADELRRILAGAPRASTTRGRRAGPSFEAVAWEWLEHRERKRGLKQSTLKDYRYLLRNHLLPAFGERPVRAMTRQEIERWHAGYERTRTAGQALMSWARSCATPSAASSSPPTRSTASSAIRSATPATTTCTRARRSTPSSAKRPTTRTPPSS